MTQKEVLDFQSKSVSARDTSAEYTVGFTKVLEIDLPEGQHAGAVLIDLDHTITHSGTGTHYGADGVESITIRNEQNEKVFSTEGGAAIATLALLLGILKGVRNLVGYDPIMATSTTSYNAWWIFWGELKGRSFKIEIVFKGLQGAHTGCTTITACATTIGASIILTDEVPEDLAYDSKVHSSMTTLSEEEGRAYLFGVDGTELSTILTGMNFGPRDFSAEQIKALENVTALALASLWAVGAAGAVQYMAGVKGGNSATQLYALACASPLKRKLYAKFNTGSTVIVAQVMSRSSRAVTRVAQVE